ncbi:MAG: amidohydrolase family protein [Pirellulaceae bacterium]|nr:amidohydrolase family protein [Pirellulaceae bacterium]
MRLDAHQHFWRYDPAEYAWIEPGSPLAADYLPTDLSAELKRCDLDGCIAVQARQTLEETRWLLELAEQDAFIRGVVGWVDLRSPQLERQLEEFTQNVKLVGVRHVVQDEIDDNFMLGHQFQDGIRALSQFDLTYDILVYPRQLPAAIRLAENFPDQPFVLDHIAKPFIKDAVLEPWASEIRDLASHSHVMCKLSGMITEAKHRHWKPADFVPYLDVILHAFTPERLMFGSDWPVALLSGSYEETYRLVADYIKPLGDDVERKIFGENACRFYGV